MTINHSLEIDFKYFIQVYKKYATESYSFLVNDMALPADHSLRFRKIF